MRTDFSVSPRSRASRARFSVAGASWWPLGRPWAVFGRSWVSQEFPRAAQERPERPPRGHPEASRNHFGSILEPPGRIFVACWLFEAISGNTREEHAPTEKTSARSARARANGKTSARSALARASRENSLDLPPGPPDQGDLEKFAARPPDYGKHERFTVAPPDHRKRERFAAGPPDYRKRERFTVGPPEKRSTQGSTRWQQLLFETPLSVFSLGRFRAWAGPPGGVEIVTFSGFFKLWNS